MATFTLFSSFNFLASQDWAWVTKNADSTHLTIGNDIYTQSFTGNYTYDQSGNVSGTTSTSNFYINNTQIYSAEGMTANAALLQQFASTTGDTQATYAYVLQSNDLINGSSGNDTILGYDGNDTLIGGAGNNYLDGGAGVDTAYVKGSLADFNISFNSSNGDSTLVRKANNDTDTLHNIENIIFDADGNWLTAGDQVKYLHQAPINGWFTLTGTAQNDVLDARDSTSNGDVNGGAGADTMLGGNYYNTYYIDNIGDRVIDTGAYWDDAFVSTATFDFANAQGVEGVLYTGSTDFIATAASRSTQVFISAGLGNDSLTGGSGDDLLTGAKLAGFRPGISSGKLDGNDTLDGGAGVDTALYSGKMSDYVITTTAGVTTVKYSTLVNGVLKTATDTLKNIEYIRFDNGTWGDGDWAYHNYQDDDVKVLNALPGQPSDGNDTITGTNVGEYLSGLLGNDLLNGLDGNDQLYGGKGNDTLDGGDGHDMAMINSSMANIVFGTDANGNFIVKADGEIDTLKNVEEVHGIYTKAVGEAGFTPQKAFLSFDGSGHAVLTGTDNNDTYRIDGSVHAVNGGAGNDTVIALGNDLGVLDTLSSVEKLILDADGNLATTTDQIIFNSNGFSSAAADLLIGTNDADTLAGLAGNDVLLGKAGNDTLFGGDGNDTLNGGDGADSLVGGLGNDTYIVDNVSDVVSETSTLAIEIDLVKASISYTLGANVENLLLTGSDAINATGNALSNTLTGNSAANVLDGGLGADAMLGGLGNDTYIVDNAADKITELADQGTDSVQASVSYTLAANVENLSLTGVTAINGTGNALNNTLTGNSAANILDGGLGADTLVGGAGNDIYLIDQSGDVVTELADAGTDEVRVLSSATFTSVTLAANVENLTVLGSLGFIANGNELNNQITGNAAANILDGGVGADTLIGGLGNDLYIVDNTGDVVTETSTLATEIDTVQASISYTLAANVENLSLTGNAAINATGNTLNNTLTGNTGNNQLDGGLGADAMLGGDGNDTYIVDNVGDKITEQADQGIDSVQASVSYSLAANVENLTLTGAAAINGTGNALNNTLTGNSAANILDGGLGADTLVGGAGNDIYLFDNTGDVVTELVDAGIDEVRATASATFSNSTLNANVEKLTILGTLAFDATGNELANTLTGNSGNNRLDGAAGTDTLIGGLGNDTLIGSNGDADRLDGGAGNDRYELASADNIVIESLVGSAGGIDEVVAGFDYELGTNLENLTLLGAAIQGTGNELNNVIMGNAQNNVLDGQAGNDSLAGGLGNDVLNGGAGNDTLDGGAGNDVLIGGDGNDVYIIDSLGDVIVEVTAASGGIDEVRSSLSYTLKLGLENLTLTGSDAINATGNALSNTLTGNTGNNQLDGGLGADAMLGGLGNDTYIVDNVGDKITELTDQGVDSVQAGVSYTLAANIENLTLSGTTAINGTGNTLNNTLTGNSAANILDGGLGADTLVGGEGNDVLIGGAGSDNLTGGSGADQFRFTLLESSVAELINDFSHDDGDKLAFAQSGIKIGNGNTLLDSAISTSITGFSKAAELVIFNSALDGSFTADAGHLSDVASLLGHANANYSIGEQHLFVVNNGTDSFIYDFKALNADAIISSNELTLLGTVHGVTHLVVNDFQLVA